ncbi:moeB [Thermococcus litoralis DSM 5473]|uniref:MoeB n=4 Tax=Thermococcaceae TaxID=2259 RepID=A0A5C0XS95_PYRFU|nr:MULTISPECIES: ThiF family adenylyltransferase [Thermococcaceae]AAL80127.1 moeB-like protein [Pyrococcus furiosus DSM 3638]AFN04571.1 moeB-like protein [Pyrococcus furiosus COM1]EHR78288.1 moeB [Thermococcus litoralis DSM 5473]QEK79659.1 moeB [Pyrococcus furiosus DSM 3638]
MANSKRKNARIWFNCGINLIFSAPNELIFRDVNGKLIRLYGKNIRTIFNKIKEILDNNEIYSIADLQESLETEFPDNKNIIKEVVNYMFKQGILIYENKDRLLPELSLEELIRMHDHICFLKSLGYTDYQKHLKKSKVLIVGLGKLGANIAYNLCNVGVGSVILFDRTFISPTEISDIYTKDAIGMKKADYLRKKLTSIFPEIEVQNLPDTINISNYLNDSDFDIIIVNSEHFNIKLLSELNDLLYKISTPYMYAWIEGSRGYIGPLIYPPDTSCFNCYLTWRFFGTFMEDKIKAINNYGSSGYIFPLDKIIGALTVLEVCKAIGSLGTPLFNKIILVEVLPTLTIRYIPILKDPKCNVCEGRWFK